MCEQKKKDVKGYFFQAAQCAALSSVKCIWKKKGIFFYKFVKMMHMIRGLAEHQMLHFVLGRNDLALQLHQILQGM